MSVHRFAQVDVFSARAGFGNPVAVVFDADDLEAATMQRFAAWTNLSETTFVLAPATPAADLRLRIFTPRQELPFAGHPAVGTAHAWLDAIPACGNRDGLVLECAAGLLPVRIDRNGGRRRLFVRAPQARFADAARIVPGELDNLLGASPKRDPAASGVNVGPTWLVAELENAAVVRAVRPDLAAIAALTTREDAVGLAVFGRQANDEAALVVRAFCPADGIAEDPVTGSANAAIGAFLHRHGALHGIGHRYRVSQGREVGRDGHVDVEIDAASGVVWIGGHSLTCINGHLDFDGSA